MITVLLPTFNAAAYLDECLASVVAQTEGRFVVLVLDGGSSDSTRAIVEAWQARDARIQARWNRRQSLVDALNEGLGLVKTPFVARLDADDVAEPRRFEEQMRFLAEHPNVDVVGTGILRMDPDGTPIEAKAYPPGAAEVAWTLLFGNALAHGTIFGRTSAFQGHRYDSAFAHAEDYDLWQRMMASSRFANLPQPLLRRREHPQSISYALAVEQAARADVVSRRALMQMAPSASPLVIDLLIDVMAMRSRPLQAAPWDQARRLLLEIHRRFVRSQPLTRQSKAWIQADLADRLALLAAAARGNALQRLACLASAVRASPGHCLRRAAQLITGRIPYQSKLRAMTRAS